MPNIPIEAWQQAVVVVLFVVGFSTMFIILVNLIIKLVTVTRGIISETTSSFQSFLIERDKSWQEYLRELRASDRDEQKLREDAFGSRNGLIVDNLKNLAAQIQNMQTFDNQHHAIMATAILDMHKAIAVKRGKAPGA
jgi:hypothetical protein